LNNCTKEKVLSIAVVIPTYNEKENLPVLIKRLKELSLQELTILVIDDNSPDGTGQRADELAREMPGMLQVMHRTGKLGLGTAYISGFQKLLESNVDYIVQMDADFSHPPEKILEMLAEVQKCDMVIGSRYVKGGSLDVNWPAWRRALSNFGNLYARVILGMSVLDVTGGYRLWKRETLSAMPLEMVRSNGYIFQVEMAYLAHRLGFKINEIPIYFAERTMGESKMNLSIQVEAALRVWTLRSRYRAVKPLKK
jgi:dolichol-phosphate mannosyltransferase